MDINKLKNDVNAHHELKEGAKRKEQEEYQKYIDMYISKLKLDELDNINKEFISAIENISDDTLQELITEQVIKHEDEETLYLKFKIKNVPHITYYDNHEDNSSRYISYKVTFNYTLTCNDTEIIKLHKDKISFDIEEDEVSELQFRACREASAYISDIVGTDYDYNSYGGDEHGARDEWYYDWDISAITNIDDFEQLLEQMIIDFGLKITNITSDKPSDRIYRKYSVSIKVQNPLK